MRRVELTWDTGNWADGIAERIMEELAYALEHPQRKGSAWKAPDSIKTVKTVVLVTAGDKQGDTQ